TARGTYLPMTSVSGGYRSCARHRPYASSPPKPTSAATAHHRNGSTQIRAISATATTPHVITHARDHGTCGAFGTSGVGTTAVRLPRLGRQVGQDGGELRH